MRLGPCRPVRQLAIGRADRLTNRHLWPVIEEARTAGATVVVIDPLRTITADSADWFIQPRPGTDVALMLAMIHVLVRDGLVDRDWVADHTVGFDDLAAHTAEWTPAHAAAINPRKHSPAIASFIDVLRYKWVPGLVRSPPSSGATRRSR